MAGVKKNLVVQGLSGMLGNTIVFRQVGDQTIVSSKPSHSGPLFPKQKAQHAKFAQAAQYAKGQMDDPAAKAEYEQAIDKQYETGYTIAVTDFLKTTQCTRGGCQCVQGQGRRQNQNKGG